MYPIDTETILATQRYGRWTTDPPTKTGYYWLRNGPEVPQPQIVEVWGQNAAGVSLCGSDYTYDVDEINGEWCGPLVTPE